MYKEDSLPLLRKSGVVILVAGLLFSSHGYQPLECRGWVTDDDLGPPGNMMGPGGENHCLGIV